MKKLCIPCQISVIFNLFLLLGMFI
jgi:hypothetical protein